jgi:uncharacterized membrane protein
MSLVSKALRVVAAMVMAMVVAGFMLAFINDDGHEFFLAIATSPIALIVFAVSALLEPHRSEHRGPDRSSALSV